MNPVNVDCCGNTLCYSCIQALPPQHPGGAKKCPLCRKQINLLLAPGRFLLNSLSALAVRCPDCSLEMSRDKFQSHYEKHCASVQVQCSHSSCQWQGTRSEFFKQHVHQCNYGSHPCPRGCGSYVHRIDTEAHLNSQCELPPTWICGFCSQRVPFHQRNTHYQFDCLKILRCQGYHLGCYFQLTHSQRARGKMQTHEITCPYVPLVRAMGTIPMHKTLWTKRDLRHPSLPSKGALLDLSGCIHEYLTPQLAYELGRPSHTVWSTLLLSKNVFLSTGLDLIFKYGLSSVVNVKYLVLNQVSLDDQAAGTLAVALRSFHQLETLYIQSSFISSDSWSCLATVALPFLKKLQRVDFSDNPRISVPVLEHICRGLSNASDLHMFGLRGTDLSGISAPNAELILQGISHVRCLQLEDCNIETSEQLRHLLHKTDKVTHLYLSNNKINPEGLKAALKYVPVLQDLGVAKNNWTSSSMSTLADTWQSLPSLGRLNLCQNLLLDDGIAHLSQSFQQLSSLRELKLESTGLTLNGIITLASHIKHLTNVTRILLSQNNKQFVEEPSDPLWYAKFKECSQLQHLDLSRNTLGLKCCNDIVKCLEELTSLKYLQLNFNLLPSDTGSITPSNKLVLFS